MKTVGLIGGMSWDSTIPYYRIINEEVKNRLGGLHSAKIILHSVEFDEIEKETGSVDSYEKSLLYGRKENNCERTYASQRWMPSAEGIRFY